MAPTIKCMSGFATDIAIILTLLLLPYLYLMMRVYRGLTLIKPFINKPGHPLSLSVIIATNRPPADLEQILADLSAQNYNHNCYEVIIADDSNGMWGEETQLNGSAPRNIRIVPNRSKGKKSALAAAIEAATGELIITTDDDCRVGPAWLFTIASFYNSCTPDMIICPVELTGKDDLFTKIQQLEFSSLQGVTAGSAAMGDPLMCNGAALAFRRAVYPAGKGFLHEKIPSGDDIFFLHWLKRNGASVRWLESPSAIVRTRASEGVKALFRQRARWASKSIVYSDTSTIITGLSVIVASLVTGSLLLYSLVRPEYMPLAFLFILVKSVPDGLIVMNRLAFNERTELMIWFPLVQLVYPFYAIISVLAGLFRRNRW
jgi:cellulose synthase/poly-beta-1,6-N-acetylglucosamine synthase-like glycosyltransferase